MMQLTILDSILLGTLSAAVVFILLFLLYMIRFFLFKRQVNAIEARQPKQQKKRKKWARMRQKMKKKHKSLLKTGLICFVLGLLCAGGSYYTRYYQETNLSSKDSEALVQGYFLVTNIEEQLTTGLEAENQDKLQANIYNLSSQLATYGGTIPDGRLSKEGKVLLKRLYTSMKQLGLNLNGLVLSDSTVIEDYLADVERVKAAQKKVFDYFRINESSLKQDN